MIYEKLTEQECYLVAILKDVSGIDLAEFSMTHAENKETYGIFRAWPFQYAWFRNKAKRHIDAAARLVGKALDVDTPILTSVGWSTMGELEDGDYVYAPDGKLVEILTAFEIMEDRPCYEVNFGSETIVADMDHLWAVAVEGSEDFRVITTLEIKGLLMGGVAVETVPNHKGERFTFVEIKQVESRPVRCIEVDHPESLYLVGKQFIPTHNTMSISLRALAFPFNYPDQEMMVTAPEATHTSRVTDDIELAYNKVKLASAMVNGKFKHKPFKVMFINGAQIYARIPQRDGSGVQGAHPTILEQDEGAKYPERGWSEIKETLKANLDNAQWRVHGVSFGVGGTFNELIAGRNPNWEVTYLPAMITPIWNEKMKQERIEEYFGYNTSDYRRNILGLQADAGSPIFVLQRLMACVDHDLSSDYNLDEYYYKNIDEGGIRDVQERWGGSVLDLIDIPPSHREYKNVWIGMDFGWTQSPSAILVFGEVPNKQTGTVLKLIARILLHKVSAPDQLLVMKHLIDYYRPVAFACDATGAGHPVYQILQSEAESDPELKFMRDRIKDCQFASKVIVGFDDRIEVDENKPDGFLDAAIKRPFIEASTDTLRSLVDKGRMLLPFDKELIGELESAEMSNNNIGQTIDAYGRSGRKQGLHNLDAMRMALFTYETHYIDYMIKDKEQTWEPPPIMFF